ncbi:MAM domain-containing glycosylphosphatidylinositol anchor protein 1 [Trichostrongylus colubriformis]|uniref:MAM domain-containing glycosylphosphatidylinositol anchor protein 1 n=1 Tax=Trichostrongylus colubriformis TaxID=6319 RepID=A0AAN8G255_TRICO
MRWLLTTIALIHVAQCQKIVTKGRTITVNEGDQLELPCYVQDLGSETIIWRRKDNLLFIDEENLAEDERMQVIKDGSNSTLTILDVEPMDMTEYVCAVSDPPQEIIYKIIVHSPPTVVISPDEPEYLLSVGDEQVVVRCLAKGNPTPTIKWSRKDGKMPSDVSIRGPHLVIAKAKKSHSGEYECTASNAAGSDSATLKIQVNEREDAANHEAPWVKTEHSFVPVKKNADVNISCAYDGTPSPQAEWFFNGYKINFSEERFRNTAQYAQRRSNHTNAILTVVGINEDSFGDYMCRISNNLGMVFAVIHVSGRPGPPAVQLDGSELSWTVRAYEPVIEYRIYYRHEKADDWNKYESIRASKNDNNGDDMWNHSVSLLPYLEAGVPYEVTVKARNALGWGSFARENVHVQLPTDDRELTSSTAVVSSVLVFLMTFMLRY